MEKVSDQHTASQNKQHYALKQEFNMNFIFSKQNCTRYWRCLDMGLATAKTLRGSGSCGGSFQLARTRFALRQKNSLPAVDPLQCRG